MVSALLEELKFVAPDVKGSPIADAERASLASFTLENKPQRRRIGSLLVETGAGGRGSRGKDDGKKKGGVGQHEQWEYPLETQPER